MLPPFKFPVMSYDIFFIGMAWAPAVHYDYSPWSLVLALAVTAVVVAVIARRLVRLAALRRQLKMPDAAD
jgi:hypothetical protein